MRPSETPSRTVYRAAVARYLGSPAGRTTTDDVALRLLALEPYSLGMPDSPSLEQLHSTRVMLDEFRGRCDA